MSPLFKKKHFFESRVLITNTKKILYYWNLSSCGYALRISSSKRDKAILFRILFEPSNHRQNSVLRTATSKVDLVEANGHKLEFC